MENTKKYKLSGLHLEVTRRCNLRCAHCLCGEPQNIDISPEVIDKFLAQVSEITSILLTGGEPLLALDSIKYLFDALKRNDVKVITVSFITNGTILDERFIHILSDFLQDKPECKIDWGISYDKFHDKSQSEKCLEFYKPLVANLGEQCSITFHEDIDWLHYSGRAWGKRSVLNVPVKGVCDAHFRPHRIKIVDDWVFCLFRLCVNGNFGFSSVDSFDDIDKKALGNILYDSLSSIFEENYRTCIYLCDECFAEAGFYNYENFQYPSIKPLTHMYEDVLYTSRIRRIHLNLIWQLREWAVKHYPDMDIREIIAGTISDDAYFKECILWLMIEDYKKLKTISKEEAFLLSNEDTATNYMNMLACTKYEKHFSKKYPKVSQDEIYHLSFAKVLSEVAALMTLSDYERALFRGNTAKGYFEFVHQHMMENSDYIKNFNPCAKIPDTIDHRGENEDEQEANKFQPNADG